MRTTAPTLEAAEGALGPRPVAFLAQDAELKVPGAVISGAEPVATALRELTSGVDAIDLETDGDIALARWPVAAPQGRPWIVCRLEVAEGQVRSIYAERVDLVRV